MSDITFVYKQCLHGTGQEFRVDHLGLFSNSGGKQEIRSTVNGTPGVKLEPCSQALSSLALIASPVRWFPASLFLSRLQAVPAISRVDWEGPRVRPLVDDD